MRHIVIPILSLLFVEFQISCSGSNEKIAYQIAENGRPYIKIKGEKALMAHDLGSIGKKSEDSILIPIPSFKDGIIQGETIPVKKGQYKYLGTISIKGTHLVLNLYYDNVDEKRKDPLSWNGEYTIKK